MTSNFSLANTASGKPERNAPGMTRLQRRQVLKGALGGVATLGLGSLGLSACGGSDAATTVTATGLEFIGMPALMAAAPTLVGEDLVTADAVGNSANVDKISNADNLKFSEKLRTLFIGEDSGQHVNNFLWAYNVDSKKLSRILSVPAGAEATGLEVADNLNGFAYVMSNFQHAGEWGSIHSVIKAGVDPLINANWNNKKSAAIGYLSGLPPL